MMRRLLISTYEMGRQPFGVASAAAWMRAAGWDVDCVDVAKEKLPQERVAAADLIGFHLPMHTATRLAAPIIASARQANRSARICAFGLYAPLNAEWLRSLGADAIFGGEFEAALVAYAASQSTQSEQSTQSTQRVPRLHFLVPERAGLPPLSKYATLHAADGTRRLVGYTEASRGCRHLCRHCPIVPIYEGQFRIVQPEVVLADLDNQIAAGAGHITFGDPDFFNGPTHAMRIARALHAKHPQVSYDVTIKVEHLLRHADLVPELAETGCAFVTSAVESVDDSVRDLLDTIDELDLVDHVAPIQLAIRLLVPEGSRLLTLPEMRTHLGSFDPATLAHSWTHPDPRVDALQREAIAIVGRRLTSDRRAIFDEVSALAHERAGVPARAVSARPARDRATVPYLNEPLYC